MKTLSDTIVAIATPLGEGGLSVLRVSGPRSIAICDSCFAGRSLLSVASTHTAHYGYFVDTSGKKIDEVVETIFRSPHSYTTEDVVEISCHGGAWLARLILEILTEAGARLARPGEFTQRAFINGRIDLTQAEAVADLIRSRSQWEQRQSLEQLGGSLSIIVRDLKARILHTCGLVELGLDFAEEGVEIVDKTVLIGELDALMLKIKVMTHSFSQTKLYREGVRTVIVGRPNVGKSSLLNVLIGRNRAIVTEIAGTTRDSISEELEIEGVRFQLTDTAGLRESHDIVESEGIRRTNHELSIADIILFIYDSSLGLHRDELAVLDALRSAPEAGTRKVIVVANKADLIAERTLENDVTGRSLLVSAITGFGIVHLKQALFEQVVELCNPQQENSVPITNLRHARALQSASEYLERAMTTLRRDISGESAAVDLMAANKSLGIIVGEITSDDILNDVFSNFCIGK